MSAIETARLLLRRWQGDDLERLVALYHDPQVARFLSVDGHPWPRARSVGTFEHFGRQWQEHGFRPGAGHRGRPGRAGYGFEVVGLKRSISTARADNAATRRVMEKCGLAFQEEFTHKGALVAWYAIDRADWQVSQAAAGQ